MLIKNIMNKQKNNISKQHYFSDNKLFSVAIIVIFLLSFFLRFSLASINRYANDHHFQVIQLIRTTHIIPDRNTPSCKQCYHPKFYYLSTAKLIDLLSLNKPMDYDYQRTFAQYVNALAGLITIGFIFSFLLKINLPKNIVLITTALIALNPRFVSINIQVTNDSFAILFSTLAIYFFYFFLRNKKRQSIILATIFTSLALLSKFSGIILLMGMVLILIVKLLLSLKKTASKKTKPINLYAMALIIFLVGTISSAVLFGPYYTNYQTAGDPLAINIPKSPPPYFIKRTYLDKKNGMISVVDSFFKFRIINLIQYPFMSKANQVRAKTLAKTSLWTQIYARFNFIQYESHPMFWKNKSDNARVIAEVSYLTALLPLAIFFYGFLVNAQNLFLGLKKYGLNFILTNSDWIFFFFAILFLVAIMKFSADYRTVSSMKSIYILPAILSFIKILADGFLNLNNKLKKLKYKKIYISAIYLIFSVLMIFYVADSILLFITLKDL